MERRRLLVHAATLLPLPLAGCLDSIGSLGDERPRSRTRTTAEATPTGETPPTRTVSLSELPEFPAGPKERPDPPEVWDESSAKSYAEAYEERRLYNEHYRPVVEEITIGCSTPDVERIERGYEVSLLCQGAVYEEASTTHGDYIGPEVVYRLTHDSVTREVVDS